MRLDTEQDMVGARQRARHIARLVGFDRQTQTSIATAVSRSRAQHRHLWRRRRVAFVLDGEPPAQALTMMFRDQGPGIADLQSILGRYLRLAHRHGVGLIGTRRLMDHVRNRQRTRQGTFVQLRQVPAARQSGRRRHAGRPGCRRPCAFRPDVLVEEVLAQNRDLLATMTELETARGRAHARSTPSWRTPIAACWRSMPSWSSGPTS